MDCDEMRNKLFPISACRLKITEIVCHLTVNVKHPELKHDVLSA